MEAVIESYSRKNVFYRSRRNLWEIPVKTAICNIFTRVNSVTGVLQRVRLNFKRSTIVLKLPGTCFNCCFCPYRMKLTSSPLFFRSLPINPAYTHIFLS